MTSCELDKVVSTKFGIESALISKNKNSAHLKARSIIFKILHQQGMSYNSIGKECGKNHHTIQRSVELTFEHYLHHDPEFRDIYHDLVSDKVTTRTMRRELKQLLQNLPNSKIKLLIHKIKNNEKFLS